MGSRKFTSEYNPMKERTPEDRHRIAMMGAKASAKTRGEAKRTKDILQIFLAMPLKRRKTADIEEIRAYEALKNQNITVNEAIQLKQIQRALNGDLASACYIRDSIGDKPAEKVDARVNDPFADLTTDELRRIIEREE